MRATELQACSSTRLTPHLPTKPGRETQQFSPWKRVQRYTNGGSAPLPTDCLYQTTRLNRIQHVPGFEPIRPTIFDSFNCERTSGQDQSRNAFELPRSSSQDDATGRARYWYRRLVMHDRSVFAHGHLDRPLVVAPQYFCAIRRIVFLDRLVGLVDTASYSATVVSIHSPRTCCPEDRVAISRNEREPD